jgi:hypothetical protein
MTTKRVPIDRVGRHRINDVAVAAYVSGDDDALRRALALRPWEWPTLPELGEPCPWPAGSGGADWWPIGQQLHRALEAAAASSGE